MTDQNVTHISMLLDRSGSMQSIAAATAAGFDAFVTEQRAMPGSCTLTLAQFDHEYEVVYADKPIGEVPPLDLKPRGRTALLDSIGRLVTSTGEQLAALPEDRRPGTVIVGIMTDGMENASHEWTHAAIKELIERQESDYSWEFLYLGANQDAIEVGAGIGIRKERSLTYVGGAVDGAMAQYSGLVSELRSAPAAARQRIAYSDSAREAAVRPGTA